MLPPTCPTLETLPRPPGHPAETAREIIRWLYRHYTTAEQALFHRSMLEALQESRPDDWDLDEDYPLQEALDKLAEELRFRTEEFARLEEAEQDLRNQLTEHDAAPDYAEQIQALKAELSEARDHLAELGSANAQRMLDQQEQHALAARVTP